MNFFEYSNDITVANYWRTYKKNSRNGDTPICYNTVRTTTSFKEILNICCKQLFIQDKSFRMNIFRINILCFFSDELKFIIENRKVIREDLSLCSFILYKLFRWMKSSNEIVYVKFKETIQKQLKLFSTNNEKSGTRIKQCIADIIANFMYKFYIKL